MRKTKLDRRCSRPPAARPATRRTPFGERLGVLRRIAYRNDHAAWGWPARFLRIRVSLVVAAVTVSVLWIAGWLVWGNAFTTHCPRPPCADAFAAQQWLDASVACAREADQTRDSASGVRAASALFHLGRIDEALTTAQRWFGSNDDAMARQVAGAVYVDRDESAQAVAMLEVALAEHLARADHEEASRDDSYLARAHLYAGLLGDAVHAAEAAVREADLTSQDDAHAQLRGRARRTLGTMLTETGDFSTARMLLWESQQALTRWPDDQAWVFLELGMLLQAKDDQASAASLFETALELASKAGVPQVRTAAHLNLAYAKRELGQLDAAERQMAELDDETREGPTALIVAGLIAADRGHHERAEQLLARAAAGAPTDDYAADIALQRGRIAERFSDMAAAERHYRTAAALVEKLRSNTNSLGLRPLVLARRRAPYRRLLSLLARQDRRFDALVVAEQLHARAWLDALVGGGRMQVSSAPPLGRRLQVDAAGALSLDELLTLLRGREVLMFTEAESDLWRFHIIDGAVVRFERLPDRTTSLLERWRAAPNDLTLADQLGDLLVPSAARVPSQRPLYIVANGVLDSAPFGALRTDGRFLIQDRVISRLPGIVALRCRPHVRVQRSGVFLGDSRDDLDAAREETNALARSLGGAAWVGTDATVERLEASRDAALLHLAVHADVDPSGARLLLANGRQVTVADIVEHEIGPRVAVLAGCATAVGRDAEGWGALSSAFLAAGSRNVIGTLQAVADSDAREIVRNFYSHGGERRPAIALAEAQRELLATAPPSLWGAFVVYGSAETADCEAAP